MIVVGDALEVIGFGVVADVGIDVPAVTFVLPDVTRDGGALGLADEVEASDSLTKTLI